MFSAILQYHDRRDKKHNLNPFFIPLYEEKERDLRPQTTFFAISGGKPITPPLLHPRSPFSQPPASCTPRTDPASAGMP